MECYNFLPQPGERLFHEFWYNVNPFLEGFFVEDNAYMISSYGRLYDRKTCKTYPCCDMFDNQLSPNRYYRVYLRDKYSGRVSVFPIHRILMLSRYPIANSEQYEVNHKDGIKCHNWEWNLEWVTPKENIRHAFNTGLAKTGEHHQEAKHTEKEIRLLCELIAKGYTNEEISQMITLSNPDVKLINTLSNLRRKHCWVKISDEYDWSNASHINGSSKKRYIMDESMVRSICEYFEKFGTKDRCTRDILDYCRIPYRESDIHKFNISIGNIRNKITYTNISKDYNF